MNPVSKDSIKFAWITAKFLSLKDVKEEIDVLFNTKKKEEEEEEKNTSRNKNNKITD